MAQMNQQDDAFNEIPDSAVDSIADMDDPSIVDTQPVGAAGTREFRVPRWLIISLIPLVLAGVFIVLALPSLLSPPPGAAIPYEVFTFGESSRELDPNTDHLVLSEDGTVGLYIPIGIEMGPGEIVMLPRKLDFVPSTEVDGTNRISAVDLFVVRPDGDVMTTTSINGSILLCFSLSADQLMQRENRSADFFIERYDDSEEPPMWLDLPSAQGWQEGQACAALDHLSLFALSKHIIATPTVLPEPKIVETTPTPTQQIEELYGFPTGSQEE